jgi:hypothetical protein
MKNKTTRNRYFQVLIFLGLDRIKFKLMSHKDLVQLLAVSGFLTQVVLMKTLYKLRTEYEGKGLYLKDFNGQLEKEENGSPFWNLFLETNIVITKRALAKLLSSELVGNKNGIDPSLKVYSLPELKKPPRKNLFSIDHENFFPGFFNRSFMQFQELSEREEVKELRELIQFELNRQV